MKKTKNVSNLVDSCIERINRESTNSNEKFVAQEMLKKVVISDESLSDVKAIFLLLEDKNKKIENQNKKIENLEQENIRLNELLNETKNESKENTHYDSDRRNELIEKEINDRFKIIDYKWKSPTSGSNYVSFDKLAEIIKTKYKIACTRNNIRDVLKKMNIKLKLEINH
jgi:predicted nuclease with TOPRIM domain